MSRFFCRGSSPRCGGAAAIEFAFILPMAIALLYLIFSLVVFSSYWLSLRTLNSETGRKMMAVRECEEVEDIVDTVRQDLSNLTWIKPENIDVKAVCELPRVDITFSVTREVVPALTIGDISIPSCPDCLTSSLSFYTYAWDVDGG